MFPDTFISSLKATVPTDIQLRALAQQDSSWQKTQYDSDSFVSRIRNRSAEKTHIIEHITDEHKDLLSEVSASLSLRKMLQVDRTMGTTWGMQCRSYVPEEFARIVYMWSKSLFSVQKGAIQSTFVYVPDWPELKILVFPKEGFTLALGSDYFGECKKGHLRMAMYLIKQTGGLGLHAGSKILRVKDKAGKITQKGILLFGLSGTGKTTLTIHDHGLKAPEGIIIRQDDVVMMRPDGFCHGTEDGYYIKTEGLDVSQKVLYDAATASHAILENVKVTAGKVDFNDFSLTKNGRGIVLRSDIKQCDDSIDLPFADIIIFITRRNDIIPAIAKLTPLQAATAFMLGESIETSAGDPTKDGQSKREVGTNPFIIGPLDEEGNRFYEILCKNPLMQCFILNTGKVGSQDKLTISDATIIMEHLARDDLVWEKDPSWGILVPKEVPGVDSKKLHPWEYYHPNDYLLLCKKLSQERVQWLKQFPKLKEGISQALTLQDI